MDKQFTKYLYERHHASNRKPDFSILKEERGELFARLIGQGKKVLDIGCRDGALTKYFVKGNEVIGVDIDSNALSRAKEYGIKTIEMDLYGDWSELEGQVFDAIIAGEVLEHVFHPEEIIKKVKNHLKTGGIFAGSVPNAFSLKNRLRYLFGTKKNTPLSDPTHINQFSKEDLGDLLRYHFHNVRIVGLGKYRSLNKISPGIFSYDLVFACNNI